MHGSHLLQGYSERRTRSYAKLFEEEERSSNGGTHGLKATTMIQAMQLCFEAKVHGRVAVVGSISLSSSSFSSSSSMHDNCILFYHLIKFLFFTLR